MMGTPVGIGEQLSTLAAKLDDAGLQELFVRNVEHSLQWRLASLTTWTMQSMMTPETTTSMRGNQRHVRPAVVAASRQLTVARRWRAATTTNTRMRIMFFATPTPSNPHRDSGQCKGAHPSTASSKIWTLRVEGQVAACTQPNVRSQQTSSR